MEECMRQLKEFCYSMQLRSTMAMQALKQIGDESRAMANRVFDDGQITIVKENIKNAWTELLEALKHFKESASNLTSPQFLGEQLQIVFRDEIARNNLFYVCIGLSIGTTCGYVIGTWIARPFYPVPVMKAVACLTLRDPDNVIPTMVKVPSLTSPSDILIRVRAASIHRIDYQIADGYGKTLRRMIQQYNSYDHQELPLVIGRGCAGVVEGVGRNSKSGLEIGDEVWLAAPWYESGVASQLVVAPESRISRKPFIIGFEGAASLPYSGCIALSALQSASLEETTCIGKRVLVSDGCSPVGCVLTQLLKKWGAYVTATCNVRSVPVIQALGADDVIAFNSDDKIYELEERDLLLKELTMREHYDVVFLTTSQTYNRDFIGKFLCENGIIIDTVEKRLSSDEYGFFMRFLCSIYVRLEKCVSFLFKTESDWGGPHICHRTLDKLAGYVNDGILQTVVDQVYTPDDAEKALAHICSAKAIGGTIITFRS
ncbi:reticulon-4-interacting protein 1, mitochondrial-like isoform X2 [Contarinia nasturtii]|uniref:reticulon-4-interacting protein 1, mitochondrial-like isoform X2 n=1 Tax=Contarinia nasturtii TaxID=265458 RepID=UPI0012D3D9BE|nr:reticulon-4-interacting protein 1, mitochondrial-like isoform X2 [Contarinia nasturtii]